MNLEIQYRNKPVTVTIPDGRVAGIYHPNAVRCPPERALIESALNAPVDSPDFSTFISGPGHTLIIVNDATRPTPTAKILDSILPKMSGTDFSVIVATGDHRTPTDSEFRYIFGHHFTDLEAADRIHVHDARNDAELVFIGTSRAGTDMWINKRGMTADRIVIIGSVEPHYFAGYTGGRKSFLPGLAGRSTITQNHKYAMLPEARSLTLAGNPVHEDMVDALASLKDKPIFSIQTVLDRDRNIYAVTAGDIFTSMDTAISAAHDVFAVEISKKEDIVVTVAPYPMDIDLYQSQKAIEHGKLALNDGGILILISACRDGIGPDTFYRLMQSCPTGEAVLKKIEGEYQLGYHKAAKLVELTTRADVWTVTDLAPEILQNIFLTPKESIQSAIDLALQKCGENARVLFLMEGSLTVPIISGVIK